jgi:hypothetical protein
MKVSVRKIRIAKRNPNYQFLRQDPGKDVPEEIFDVIATRFPNYLTSETLLHLERPKGHPELDEFLQFAVQAGVTLPKDRSAKPAQITILDYEVYTREAQDAAAFVECAMQKPTFESVDTVQGEDGLGLRYLFSRHSKHTEDQIFGAVVNLHHVIAVRGKAKAHLESADLKQLSFVPIRTDAPDGGWPSDIEPLYFVWSEYGLPPVALPVFDNFGVVYPPEGRPEKIKRGCYLLDGYEMNASLKYKHVDHGAFDIARSYERFGGDQPCYHKLVYSQRARRALEAIGMNLELRPVVSE